MSTISSKTWQMNYPNELPRLGFNFYFKIECIELEYQHMKILPMLVTNFKWEYFKFKHSYRYSDKLSFTHEQIFVKAEHAI